MINSTRHNRYRLFPDNPLCNLLLSPPESTCCNISIGTASSCEEEEPENDYQYRHIKFHPSAHPVSHVPDTRTHQIHSASTIERLFSPKYLFISSKMFPSSKSPTTTILHYQVNTIFDNSLCTVQPLMTEDPAVFPMDLLIGSLKNSCLNSRNALVKGLFMYV